jgi:hypothetical protein
MAKRLLDEATLELFRKWGSEGGRKASHTLTPEQAKKMVKAREAKRKKRKGK